MDDMMGIIVPLRIEAAAQVMSDVVLVLQHQVDEPAWFDGPPNLCCQLVGPVPVGDRVDRIKTQAVEAVLHHPVKSVLGEEASHLGPAEVDRRPPGRLDVIAEECRRVGGQVIPVGTEVVVDHIEKDHQPMFVGRVDQRLQLVR
jgi:hypothetical protein